MRWTTQIGPNTGPSRTLIRLKRNVVEPGMSRSRMTVGVAAARPRRCSRPVCRSTSQIAVCSCDRCLAWRGTKKGRLHCGRPGTAFVRRSTSSSGGFKLAEQDEQDDGTPNRRTASHLPCDCKGHNGWDGQTVPHRARHLCGRSSSHGIGVTFRRSLANETATANRDGGATLGVQCARHSPTA
jgi:hypothetical protein